MWRGRWEKSGAMIYAILLRCYVSGIWRERELNLRVPWNLDWEMVITSKILLKRDFLRDMKPCFWVILNMPLFDACRGDQFSSEYLRRSTSLRTYFHTISISINWVFFSALRIVPAQISRKFWRIQSPICTCICIQFIWQISCDALYAQWIRCYSLSSGYLFHILSKLGNVQVCPIAAKRRFWSLKKFAHWRWWS